MGYLQVRSFVMDAGRFEQVERALDGLATTDALILDVRMNGGGDENLARRIAGRFTDRRRRYARTQVRDPTRPGIAFREPTERWLEPLPGRKPDRRRVVVLQGPGCVSATEGFLLMARVLPTVTTVGLPSRGASGNPRPFPLLPHVQVWSSTWRSLTPEGACIEGVGLPPDVTVEADHRRDDPTLERAIALLGAG
ncbi:MAG: S41 family peptidase [Planctomycetota bacterium]